MDIIYLGLMFCEDSLSNEFKMAKKAVAMAPHKFQTSLLRGLEGQEDVRLSVVHIPPTGSFPINSRQVISPSYKWGKNNYQIGYINLPWIKHEFQRVSLYRQVRGRIVDPANTCIILYSLYEPFLKIVWKIKKEFPTITVCLLHTDAVPGRDDMEKYMTPAARRRGDRAVRLAKCCDRFILLSENLTAPLEVGDRPYIVTECICDDTQRAADTSERINGVFLYTGVLDKEFGVCALAHAFKQMPELQLWICGRGNADDEIQQLSAECPNIQCFGYVTQEKIKELQNACSFLINPRRPSGTYTKYSFPSKTAEYMMTGKPVIMYKLEAIPNEYDEYLNYLEGDSSDAIAEELKRIAGLDYGQLADKAMAGRKFMLENKSASVVGKRIIQFLKY